MNEPANSSPISLGGCLCGAVRYEFSGPRMFDAVCHCRHCQRQSGSAFSLVTAVAQSAFTMRGETCTYVDRGNSGRPLERVFCPKCGSALVSRIEPLPDLVLIKAGTLDDPSVFTPTIEVFCDSALSFVQPMAGTDRYAASNI